MNKNLKEIAKALYARTLITKLIHTQNIKIKIKRQPCSICGFPFADAHHEDYNKPLEITWFCRRHHKERHRELNGIIGNKKKRGICFEQAYYSLTNLDQGHVYDLIMFRTGWSNATFNNKRNGTTIFKKPEIPVIEEIFKDFELNSWTGERL